ncbi:unnamed protein product [Effrenium voratum]|nr:unnamed protein product [Effrenium voratum]
MPTDFSMENMPHTSPHRKPVRSRSISSWVRCRDELLSGIFRELCELGPACRRQVLQQHFSQGQRAALEQWMLRRRSTPKPRGRKRKPKGCQVSKWKSCRPARKQDPRGALQLKGVVCTTNPTSGKQSFYAVAYLGILRFTSRKTQDLWEVTWYREALLCLVHRVRDLHGAMEERLLCAVTEAGWPMGVVQLK